MRNRCNSASLVDICFSRRSRSEIDYNEIETSLNTTDHNNISVGEASKLQATWQTISVFGFQVTGYTGVVRKQNREVSQN